MGVRLVRVGHQLKLYDPCPLDVLLAFFVIGHGVIAQQDGLFDARDHEVPKLLALAVERAYMPAQACVDQRERHDFTNTTATADGVVCQP